MYDGKRLAKQEILLNKMEKVPRDVRTVADCPEKDKFWKKDWLQKVEYMQVLNCSERPLSVYHTRRKCCMEASSNSVKCLVTGSLFGIKSYLWRV